MFEITVDDSDDAYVVAHTLYARHERAVAAYKGVDAHSGTRCGVHLVDHVGVGYVVYLYLDPSRTTLLCVLYLVVEESQYARFHRVWRYEQFAEAHR